MMALTAGLAQPLQQMIDERLDTIDRVLLMAGTARDQRHTTVSEVESQIHEMLLQRAPTDPQRADVLAVLARLDPPEAYVPEEGMSVPAGLASVRPASRSEVAWKPASSMSSVLTFGSAASGIMGALALAGVMMGTFVESVEIMLLCGVISLFFGLLATIGGVASLVKLRESTHPQLILPVAIVSTLFLPLALLNLAQLYVVLIFGELAIFPALGCTILMTDAVVTYAAWRTLSNRMTRLAA
jgi:hypothetical protein